MIRSLAKSATTIGLVNVALVVAWLVPDTMGAVILVIAACFVISYLYSFGWGCIKWFRQAKTELPE